MKAAVLHQPSPLESRPLRIEEIARPDAPAGHVLLRVRACGVCRTDLHIVEGELAPHRHPVIPGHQIVGEAAGGAGSPSRRVGVCWLGGTDASCWYCRHAMENLCDSPASPVTTWMAATRNMR